MEAWHAILVLLVVSAAGNVFLAASYQRLLKRCRREEAAKSWAVLELKLCQFTLEDGTKTDVEKVTRLLDRFSLGPGPLGGSGNP